MYAYMCMCVLVHLVPQDLLLAVLISKRTENRKNYIRFFSSKNPIYWYIMLYLFIAPSIDLPFTYPFSWEIWNFNVLNRTALTQFFEILSMCHISLNERNLNSEIHPLSVISSKRNGKGCLELKITPLYFLGSVLRCGLPWHWLPYNSPCTWGWTWTPGFCASPCRSASAPGVAPHLAYRRI